jgi:small subunit ribosomal protein S7
MKILNSTIETHFDLFFKKFINLLMIDGKKTKASKTFFKMLLILKKQIQKDLEKKKKSNLNTTKNEKDFSINITLLHLILQALNNVTPSLEVRKVRVAGSTYIVPAVLSKKKQETLALKWLIESAKKKQKNSNVNFSSCLADELLDASRKAGQARQKRDELHRLAQMNRAYIRYRWW